jgi:hypothetical protein
MPMISKASAPNVADFGVAFESGGDLDDYTFDFVSIRQTHSLAPVLKGLPGDRCPCPHWGYLFSGRITVTYADHEEVYQAGDAFYMSPGHVPAAEAGSELLQISPKGPLAEVTAVMASNAARMADGA